MAQSHRLLRAVQAAPSVSFVLEDDLFGERDEGDTVNVKSLAHAAGVNSLTIDKFEGR